MLINHTQVKPQHYSLFPLQISVIYFRFFFSSDKTIILKAEAVQGKTKVKNQTLLISKRKNSYTSLWYWCRTKLFNDKIQCVFICQDETPATPFTQRILKTTDGVTQDQ